MSFLANPSYVVPLFSESQVSVTMRLDMFTPREANSMQRFCWPTYRDCDEIQYDAIKNERVDSTSSTLYICSET